MQANILAKYRPRLNITLLIPELNQTKETAAKAIAYFKNTGHIVLYYEDLVNNRTLRLAIFFFCYHVIRTKYLSGLSYD